MTIYFISGLGADERMFQKLTLPQHWTIQYIQWLSPLRNETLVSYCHRLSENINASENFILVGLSFGGIIAVELNKILQPKLTILIASVSIKHELPLIASFFAKTKLDKIVPASLVKIPNPIMNWLFGATTSEEKKLLKLSFMNTSSHFFKWAIHNIINWNNEERPNNLIHIQGTKDHLLPVKNTKADIKIEGGGHLMVYSKADVISHILIDAADRYL